MFLRATSVSVDGRGDEEICRVLNHAPAVSLTFDLQWRAIMGLQLIACWPVLNNSRDLNPCGYSAVLKLLNCMYVPSSFRARVAKCKIFKSHGLVPRTLLLRVWSIEQIWFHWDCIICREEKFTHMHNCTMRKKASKIVSAISPINLALNSEPMHTYHHQLDWHDRLPRKCLNTSLSLGPNWISFRSLPGPRCARLFSRAAWSPEL
jgi:hypothetical protein